jgi:hypothetical protein
MAKRTAPSLEEIAAEVGRLYGTTEVHAKKWLEQRRAMLEALTLVRDKAAGLIKELGSQKSPRDTGGYLRQPGERPNRKKRRVSGAARAKVAAARRRR